MINDMTIGDIKEILNFFKPVPVKNDDGPWEIDKNYFIRTVTMSLTGTLVSVGDKELVLKDAAWIADSGRFHKALQDITECSEVEPFQNNIIIGRGSIIDATIIDDVITVVK